MISFKLAYIPGDRWSCWTFVTVSFIISKIKFSYLYLLHLASVTWLFDFHHSFRYKKTRLVRLLAG